MYERWSKNNLINEILRLNRLIDVLEDPELQHRERAVAAPARKDAEKYHPEDLVPRDVGGGFTVLLPPNYKE